MWRYLGASGLLWTAVACVDAPATRGNAAADKPAASATSLAATRAPSGASASGSALSRPAPSGSPGSPAADGSRTPAAAPLRGVTGPELLEQIRSSQHRAVLVNVWASWCGPCRRELPMLQSLSINLAPQGIGTWFVSVDDLEAKPKALQLLDEHAITSPSYLVSGPLDAFKLAINPRWPGMIPATFLFDGTGKLRYFWGGPVYESDLLPIIEGFLAGRAIDGEADFTIAPGQVER